LSLAKSSSSDLHLSLWTISDNFCPSEPSICEFSERNCC
jgi:hypothetical protein